MVVWCFGNPELPTGVGGARCWVGVGWGAKGQVPCWGEGLASGEYVSWRSDICLQADGSTVSE